MKNIRTEVWAVIALTAALLSGCGGSRELSAKNPVTVTVWNYYNGTQKESFDQLVRKFNTTEGRDKGIIVEAFSKGSINELAQAVYDSAKRKVGSDNLPDVCAVYADTAYELDQQGLAADISSYLTEEELAEYVDAYIEEGHFDSSGSLKLFPVAKSTEVFAINKTDWDTFANATGASEDAFATWEGIVRTAEAYYQWTDSLTPEPDDGKAFFGRDAFANYIIIGSLQLGHEIFTVSDGKLTVDLDREAMRRLWDNYYVPYVNGYFASYGKFRSDDVKTGGLLAFVGATSGVTYFPNTVTLEDGTSYEIESQVYPLPNFEGTSPMAVQQGAGMMILKSDEKSEYASSVFLKWFTEEENNIEFAMASGYLPVKKTANNKELIVQTMGKGGGAKAELINENFLVGLDIVNQYQLYTTKPFDGGDKARVILNTSMDDKAKEDY